jgi:predicted DNA-binding transcriptional regulator YafY
MTPNEIHEAKVELLRRGSDPDVAVCKIRYRDEEGKRTDRYISTVQIRGSIVRALCLCRTEVRQFKIARIQAIKLIPASDVVMPMPITDPDEMSLALTNQESNGIV